MFSVSCFLVFKSFHKQDICHWATLWLLTNLLFSLFGGSYITPFRWVLWFQNNSAVIHKVAQCVIPMQIRYILIYFIHHIRTGPLHMFKLFSSWIYVPRQPHTVTSGQITVIASYEQKAGSLFYTEHNQWQTSQPKQSIISTYHYLQLQKILPDRFPVTHSVQN